jgi:hypothetical protein
MPGFVVGAIDRLRLRRTTLSEKNTEDDHHPDRKEFTLPILQKFKPELIRSQILNEIHRAAAMLQLLDCCIPWHRLAHARQTRSEKGKTKRASANTHRVVVPQARYTETDLKQSEQREQYDREAISAENVFHVFVCYGPRDQSRLRSPRNPARAASPARCDRATARHELYHTARENPPAARRVYRPPYRACLNAAGSTRISELKAEPARVAASYRSWI